MKLEVSSNIFLSAIICQIPLKASLLLLQYPVCEQNCCNALYTAASRLFLYTKNRRGVYAHTFCSLSNKTAGRVLFFLLRGRC